VTTAAALDKLAADFKFRTASTQAQRRPVLIGDGDPSFRDAELLPQIRLGLTTTAFKNWARPAQVRPARRHVQEDRVSDDSISRRPVCAPGTGRHYQLHKRIYVAQISGLNLNGTAVDFYLGGDDIGRDRSST
jgi:hypothetical protein